MARKRKQEAALQEQAQAPRSRLTPVDVQEKVFRLSFRGYNERDVDEFLDHVTEELALLHEENKRLREAIAEARRGGSPEALRAAEQRAAETVRQAREQAARLLADAESRAAAGTGGVAAATPSAFLTREREFLQRLAGLVQEHAGALKEDARRARTAAPGPQAPPEPAPAPPPPPPPEPPAPEPPPVPETPAAEGEAKAAWDEGWGTEGDQETWDEAATEGGEEAWSEGDEGTLPEWDGAVEEGATEPEPQGEPLFAVPDEAEAPREQPRRSGDEEGPSLKELFWGEE